MILHSYAYKRFAARKPMCIKGIAKSDQGYLCRLKLANGGEPSDIDKCILFGEADINLLWRKIYVQTLSNLP
jgi:hypothetical protein